VSTLTEVRVIWQMAMGDDAGAMTFIRAMMPRESSMTAAALASQIAMDDEEPTESH